jgi:hypothetical protein
MATNANISLADVMELFRALEQRRFFGVTELKWEAGHIVLVRKSENFKTRAEIDCRSGRGDKDERTT